MQKVTVEGEFVRGNGKDKRTIEKYSESFELPDGQDRGQARAMIQNQNITALDLFSGIGGFSLGFERAGIGTAAFCEKEEYCQKVLNKNFPNTPIFSDIKELSFARNDYGLTAKYKEREFQFPRINLVAGGFPCQPFSVAGKQKATKDDRDLWPEMFRVIKEIRPTWVIGENVAGFINLGFTRTKTNLESIGYSVLPFEIPACAVGARHERKRNWIIAHLDSQTVPFKQGRSSGKSWEGALLNQRFGEFWTFADSNGNRLGEKTNASEAENDERVRQDDGGSEAAFDLCYERGPESGMVRIVHGLSPKLDRDHERSRRKRVAALGNSIVPYFAEIFGRAIVEIELQKRERE